MGKWREEKGDKTIKGENSEENYEVEREEEKCSWENRFCKLTLRKRRA